MRIAVCGILYQLLRQAAVPPRLFSFLEISSVKSRISFLLFSDEN